MNPLRVVPIGLFILGVVCAPAIADPAALGFTRDVLPILQRHCVECHSGWFPKAGLRLNSLENVLSGSPSGPAVVPGKREKGWIPFVLRQERGRYRMPPLPALISAAEKVVILDWIEQGARP